MFNLGGFERFCKLIGSEAMEFGTDSETEVNCTRTVARTFSRTMHRIELNASILDGDQVWMGSRELGLCAETKAGGRLYSTCASANSYSNAPLSGSKARVDCWPGGRLLQFFSKLSRPRTQRQATGLESRHPAVVAVNHRSELSSRTRARASCRLSILHRRDPRNPTTRPSTLRRRRRPSSRPILWSMSGPSSSSSSSSPRRSSPSRSPSGRCSPTRPTSIPKSRASAMCCSSRPITPWALTSDRRRRLKQPPRALLPV